MDTNEKKEFVGWWIFILGLVIITVFVLAILGYTGKLTGTVIEREVFENSYQKTASDDSRNLRYKSELAKVKSLLEDETDIQTRKELKAQRAMLEVQLKGQK